MARAMMDEVDVPHNFLGEIVEEIVYAANRTQLRPSSEKTPNELWGGGGTYISKTLQGVWEQIIYQNK